MNINKEVFNTCKETNKRKIEEYKQELKRDEQDYFDIIKVTHPELLEVVS